MIMPTKHTNIEQSLLGFGGYLLQKISDGASIDSLWQNYLDDFSLGIYKAKHSFDTMLLALIFLYSINAIKDDNGEIKKCS